jgi:hypothetical protein
MGPLAIYNLRKLHELGIYLPTAYTQYQKQTASEVVIAAKAIDLGMKHTEGVVNFLFAEHPVFTGLHATGIVHGKCCGWVVQR